MAGDKVCVTIISQKTGSSLCAELDLMARKNEIKCFQMIYDDSSYGRCTIGWHKTFF